MPLPNTKYSLVPKWVECPDAPLDKDSADGFVCYDFEGIQKILSVEQDAIKWHNMNLHLDAQVKDLTTANTKLKTVVTSLEGDVDRLSEGYSGAMDSLGKAERRAQDAEARDVFGGALPYVITGLVVAFLGGFLAGWFGHPEEAKP